MRTSLLAVSAVALLAACSHAPSAPPAPPAPEWFVSVPGGAGELRVSVGGAGTTGHPVLFVHGLGADLEVWRPQLEYLRRDGVRAVAYDQRGHGSSERPRDGVYTIAALAEDLDRVVRALGLHRVVLVGHSMAGGVLAAYVSQHSDVVAGVVFVDAVGALDALPPQAIQQMVAKDATLDADGVRAGFEEMLGPKARPQTREKVLAAVAKLEPRAFAALRRSMAETNARAAYARYGGPAVAIEAGPTPLPFLAAAGLGVRRVPIADASHWLMLDEPAATNAAIDAFLATLPR